MCDMIDAIDNLNIAKHLFVAVQMAATDLDDNAGTQCYRIRADRGGREAQGWRCDA
nr:hypothetical protein [Mesorhizobium sp. LNHC220B00]